MLEEDKARVFPDVSVVVNTYNRVGQLVQTLQAMRWLDYPGRFEVVVINGPSDDGTQEVLDAWPGALRLGRVDVANLSVSRNEGIRLAAGEIVVFIDDDAVPEPEWLTRLVVPYQDPMVGAVGGFVLDHTGYAFQYTYGEVNRFAEATSHGPGPTPDRCYPGSWSIPHMMGTNSSYRRAALVEIGGYDEFFEYFLDESDVQVRLADAGWLIAQVSGARVHHHFAPSHLRNAARAPRSYYPILKNKLYFALRHARDYVSTDEIFVMFHDFVEQHRDGVRWFVEQGALVEADRGRFDQDAARAQDDALQGALAGGPVGAALGEAIGPLVQFETFDPGATLRIVLCSQEYPPERLGGIGTFTHDLASSLAALGHVVHVLTRSNGDSRVDWVDGVWVHRLAVDVHAHEDEPERGDVPSRPWAWSATCRDEVEKIEQVSPIDVVEAPIWDAEPIALLRAGARRVVLSLHTSLGSLLELRPDLVGDESWMREFGTPMMAAEREVLVGAAAIRANSRAVLDRLQESYALDLGDRAQVIPHGLLMGTHQEARHAARVQRVPGTVGVLFVGRLEERKGVDTLLDAFVVAHDEDPRLRLYVVGDDSLPWSGDRQPIRDEFLARSDIPTAAREAVRFLGSVSAGQLEFAYRNSDIFVAPSRYESFGLVFVEAMARGLPVIGTLAGGIPEVVRDGLDGVLVPVGDVPALAEAMVGMSRDEERRAQMGARGAASYAANFTADVMAGRSVAFYREAVLNQGAAADPR